MWGKNSKSVTAKINTLIGEETEIHGDVHFTGGLHIDGVVKGNVIAEESENSVLTLSEKGAVEGEVRVPNMILNGTVVGDVYATKRIELSIKARVSGNVYYNLIEMAIGASVNGNLVHQIEPHKPMLAYDNDEDAVSTVEERVETGN